MALFSTQFSAEHISALAGRGYVCRDLRLRGAGVPRIDQDAEGMQRSWLAWPQRVGQYPAAYVAQRPHGYGNSTLQRIHCASIWIGT